MAGRSAVKAEDASLPAKYQAVPDVGPVYNVSLEKVLACQPTTMRNWRPSWKKVIFPS